ncbi:MAG: ribonuclease HII [Chloroflexota bacterium]|nr:MAG: ribonuclease HII [Chloroflexota bacterium]
MGPISGPIVSAAVILAAHGDPIEGLRDSKALSRPQRQRLESEIRRLAIAIGVGAASVAEIESLNVLCAARLAMRRAIARVGAYDIAIVDGRPSRYDHFGPCRFFVGGDALSASIACASIVAKETRDRLMRRLAIRHPEYGWERNAGYASRQHLDALREYGPTPYHRRGYRPVQARLALDENIAAVGATA